MTAYPWPVVIAFLAGAWLAAAVWATWRGRRLAAAAAAVLDENARLSALIGSGPAMALLIGRDGKLQGDERLAAALGLEEMPERWADLLEQAFSAKGERDALAAAVEEAATGGAFSLTVRPTDAAHTFCIQGGPAPAFFAGRTVTLWFTDVSRGEEEVVALRARLERRSVA